MTTAPYVDLFYHDLPGRVEQADSRLGTHQQQMEAALSSYRMLVVKHAKQEIAKKPVATAHELLAITDLAAQLYLGKFSQLVGPVAIAQYTAAYKRAGAGDVPAEVVAKLAQEHADRLGKYFNDTSRDALVQGFQTFVNRGVVARVAADKVLSAFGLTPRQMSGYTSLSVQKVVNNPTPLGLKARATEYILRSFMNRSKTIAKQELLNMDHQALQTAWLWMQQNGKLSAQATKTWLTARDEKTCRICAPMHGKKVLVSEQFTLPNDIKVWMPGVHPNCRCDVRMNDPADLVRKADDDWDPKEHPRGGNPRNRGQFSRVQRQPQRGRLRPQPPVAERPTGDVIQPTHEPVIETAPEEAVEEEPFVLGPSAPPAFSLGSGPGTSFSLGTPQSAEDQKFVLGEEAKEEAEPEFALGDKFVLGDSDFVLGRRETPLAPAGGYDFTVDVAEARRHQGPPPTKKGGGPHIPRVPVEQVVPIPGGESWYYVTEDPRNDYTWVQQPLLNLADAIHEARALRDAKISEDLVTNFPGEYFSFPQKNQDGVDLQARIDPETANAWAQQVAMPGMATDTVEVPLYEEHDPNGLDNPVDTIHLRRDQVLANMGLDPEGYGVTIVEVASMHAPIVPGQPSRGSIDYISNDEIQLTGKYKMVPDSAYVQDDPVDRSTGFDAYVVEPMDPAIVYQEGPSIGEDFEEWIRGQPGNPEEPDQGPIT